MDKILIIAPAWVGDMVMAQSLFSLLKNTNPHCHLTVLAPAWSEPLLARMPEVDKSIVMPLGHGQLLLKKRYELGKSLRKEHFTKAFVLPNSWKSALIPFWAKVPERRGWRGEMRYGLLNDMRILDEKAYPLMVQRFIALAYSPETLPTTSYPIPQLQVHRDKLPKTLNKFNLHTDKPILALCPGAEFGPSKQWPASFYGEVAEKYGQKGWQVWIFGSPKDKEVAEKIQQQITQPCVDLTGKTTLGEAIDLLSLSSNVLTNDSGLMHIAAALNKPLVAVYGSTSPAFTPPLGANVKIVKSEIGCSPCFKRECPLEHLNCMKQLPPNKILEVLKENERHENTTH